VKIIPLTVVTVILMSGFTPLTLMQVEAQPSTLFGVTAEGVESGKAKSSNLYSINPNTGAADLIGSIGFKSCSGIAIHPATRLMFGACNTNPEGAGSGTKVSVLVSIDPRTGAGTLIGETGIENDPINGFDISDISFKPNGQLFGYVTSSEDIVTIDTTTGAATLKGPTGNPEAGNGIAWLPGDTLFHADDTDLSTVNPTTGALTFVASLNFPDGVDKISGMDFQPGTNILYGSTGGGQFNPGPNLVTIDINPGDVTIVGDTGLDGLTGLAFDFPPVGGTILPLDTTALLLAGAQMNAAWLIPVIVSGIGFAIVILRKL